ncbi:MAG TPA: DUF2493 domain-containing protein [Xanthobacteraceae bacterium]
MIRVLVCGGRDYDDELTVYAVLDKLHAEHPFELLMTGGASGADQLAVEWAKQHDVRTKVFVADRNAIGRKAGPMRNQRMLDEGKPDTVIAFPGGRGTADMVTRALKMALSVIAIP